MVCCCSNMRNESKVRNLFCNKFVTIVAGVIQFLISLLWTTALVNFIIQPGHMKEIIHNMNIVYIIISVLNTIILVVFLGILLCGIFKERQTLISAYQNFIVYMTVSGTIRFLINLVIYPTLFGWSGFLGNILIILLQVLLFCIITNYFVSLQAKQANSNPV